MYQSLKIEGFRAFKHLDVENLTRVNLFVGRNNAGKTSVLEAMEVLAAGGRPAPLLRSARRRNELGYEPRDERTRFDTDVSHLFHGHDLKLATKFDISGTKSGRSIAVHCEAVEYREDGAAAVPPLFPEMLALEPPLALRMTGTDLTEEITVPVSSSGAVLPDARRSAALWAPGSADGRPVTFLGTEGADAWILQQLWDALVLTDEENRVINALKIVEPDLERIAFTGRDAQRMSVAFAKLKGHEERVPLGSLGDGIRRLLALAVYLARSSGGLLLVDEIDTGLHHSTLEEMWKILIETARRLDVQVFATSHSGDCLRSLAWLQTDSPDLAGDVSVHRIERGAASAVRYSAEEISIAARHHIEVRG